jgi:hypothetical protein
VGFAGVSTWFERAPPDGRVGHGPPPNRLDPPLDDPPLPGTGWRARLVGGAGVNPIAPACGTIRATARSPVTVNLCGATRLGSVLLESSVATEPSDPLESQRVLSKPGPQNDCFCNSIGHVVGTKFLRQKGSYPKTASELVFYSGRDRRRSGDLTLFRRALYLLSYPTG